MYTQKAFKNGNSLVITLPRELTLDFNIRDGSEIVVSKNNKGIQLSPKKAPAKAEVDIKFAKMVDEFMEEHKDVLQKLANN